MKNNIDAIGSIGAAPIRRARCFIKDPNEPLYVFLADGKTLYLQQPVDTTGVALPDDLLALTERIAENVHDVWALSRIREGWQFGEKKDSTAKTTPCLVPYHCLWNLPFSEHCKKKKRRKEKTWEACKIIMVRL